MKSFFVKGVEVTIAVNHVKADSLKKEQVEHKGTVVDCDSQFVSLRIPDDGIPGTNNQQLLVPFSRIVSAWRTAPAVKAKKGK